MKRGNFGLITIFFVIILFLYFASFHNSPFNQNRFKRINYNSDVSGQNGMVVSASKYATQVGLDVLRKGGNAVDAAVAVAFTLSVTFPQAGNIGGGGFIMIKTKDTITSVDFREKAPSASTQGMFLDKDSNFVSEKSQFGYLSVGVPGSVAGLLYALEKYGTLPRDSILNPAIDLAENGFEIEQRFAESLNAHKKEFSKFASSKRVFTKSKGGFSTGEKFIQKDLANTLKLIRDEGRDGFYKGTIADLIEKEMQRGGGLITKKDLENYYPVERKVLSGNYKGYDLYSVAPPSSGGVALITLLNMIENDPVPDASDAVQMSEYYHILIECMKQAYADRSEYLGDPDFKDLPYRDLLSKQYAKEKRKKIRDTVTPSIEIQPGLRTFYKEGNQTTHISVIDKDGNMASLTTTINDYYGSFVVVDGAGFLLNDEMDDFASKPGAPNMYGLVGSDANSIQPNKRMLSSMTPTLIFKDKSPFMVLGSPGGAKIITSVLLTILNVIDFNYSLDTAVDKPRFHHQWLPDYVQYEAGAFKPEVMDKLKNMGYTFQEVSDYGSVNSILVDWSTHTYYGHTDRRGYGAAMGY